MPIECPYPEELGAKQFDLATLRPWQPDIGEHAVPKMNLNREPGMGFAKIFGLPDLRSIRFGELAAKVDAAYRASVGKGRDEDLAKHWAWAEQLKGLQQWVRLGVVGIYQLKTDQPHERYLSVIPTPPDAGVLREGHHRSLALWILGERQIWAREVSE
ncbi:hypothetical protein ACFL59_15745 [Planctomycetota bacterium]